MRPRTLAAATLAVSFAAAPASPLIFVNIEKNAIRGVVMLVGAPPDTEGQCGRVSLKKEGRFGVALPGRPEDFPEWLTEFIASNARAKVVTVAKNENQKRVFSCAFFDVSAIGTSVVPKGAAMKQDGVEVPGGHTVLDLGYKRVNCTLPCPE